jgi:hypothetical protein
MSALGGLGYLPGVSTRSEAELEPVRVHASWWAAAAARNTLGRLVPAPLIPQQVVPLAAMLALVAGAWLTLVARGWRLRALIVSGTGIATVAMAGMEVLVSAALLGWLVQGALWLAAAASLVRRRPWDLLFVLAWGLVTQLPLYRVVYNAAGNVTYFPDTYWALVWGLLAVALLRQALQAAPRDRTPAPEPLPRSTLPEQVPHPAAEAPAPVR